MTPSRAALVLGFLVASATACSPPRPGFPDDVSPDTSVDMGAPTDVEDAGIDRFEPPRDVQPIGIDRQEPDVLEVDGGGVYDDGGSGADVRECPPPDAGPCERTRPFGCTTTEICDDGLDNDCDGRVDEGCACVPGTVQRCFLGPPARRGVGVCADGMQTCRGSGEFGCWGPCEGGIAPSAETCDNADNDCDGCPDNHLCCRATLGSCPSGDDPRIPVGRPFEPYTLMGRTFYTGTATSWQWRVVGGPCDQMLYATSSSVSYTVMGAGADPRVTTNENLTFNPTLSGDYQVTLTIRGTDGLEFECTFLVKIRAPGFRAELCWDRTGMTDVDFWVHEPGTEEDWLQNNSTCFYGNCRNAAALNWGYPPSTGGGCREAVGGVCNNPRLDVDNISDEGIPENINVDRPNDGDTFRVAVNYFGGSGRVHPMVNVYCGGALVATYGGADVGSLRFGPGPISGFDTSGGNATGSLWRVVDVQYNATMDTCTLTPIIRRGTMQPCVETNSNRTYNGETCARAPAPLPRPDGGVTPRDAGMVGECM